MTVQREVLEVALRALEMSHKVADSHGGWRDPAWIKLRAEAIDLLETALVPLDPELGAGADRPETKPSEGFF